MRRAINLLEGTGRTLATRSLQRRIAPGFASRQSSGGLAAQAAGLRRDRPLDVRIPSPGRIGLTLRQYSSTSTLIPPLQPYKTHPPSSLTPSSPLIHSFFDPPTSTFTFLVVCPETLEAIIIDPVLDFDLASGRVGQQTAKGLARFVEERGYSVGKIIETHVHADHLTAAYALKKILPNSPPVLIGSRVIEVQFRFGPSYAFRPTDFKDSFDGFLLDNEPIECGKLKGMTYEVPGHTPDSMAILFGDCCFVGDSIFLPDVGTARADFPGGSAETLYASINKLLQLDGDFRIFSGHDYPDGRDKSCFSKVSDQQQLNKHVGGGAATLESFVQMRKERDAKLGTPKLLHAALQVNLRGGRMPPQDADGAVRLRWPLGGDMPE